MRRIDLKDIQLIQGLAGPAGEACLSEIYRRYWRRLLAVAFNHLNDKDQAEEVVQNVFISLWNRRHHLQIQELSRYLAMSVKYQIFSQLRTRTRSRARFTELSTVSEKDVGCPPGDLYPVYHRACGSPG